MGNFVTERRSEIWLPTDSGDRSSSRSTRSSTASEPTQALGIISSPEDTLGIVNETKKDGFFFWTSSKWVLFPPMIEANRTKSAGGSRRPPDGSKYGLWYS
ncbi:hypothetical protein RRF57_010745 [Xylaria bambusicola]|uniref:Uncharacterized protein n=1 Tax=Xylaria bambusicola TaxID=326684 RepID=A0AAN7ZDA9_9PEZI